MNSHNHQQHELDYASFCVDLSHSADAISSLGGADSRSAGYSGPSKVFAGAPQLLQEVGAGEGPAWHPELGLLTSGEGHIYRRDKQGKSSIYRSNAGSNGLLFDRQGRLVICEPVRRRVTRVELNDDLTVLAETFGGKKFNHLTTWRSIPRVAFTSPTRAMALETTCKFSMKLDEPSKACIVSIPMVT